MDDTTVQRDATIHDPSRPTATMLDTDYTLTIEQVADLYAEAGHPRTIRSLQRHCAKGHLDSKKKETAFGGEVYIVTPQSVARHIAQIKELTTDDMVAIGHDASRQVATHVAARISTHTQDPTPATSDDTPRYVARLETELEQAKDDRDFLREQIDRKDKTIDALIERDRETNCLVRGLQEMLTPLLGGPRREPPADRPIA
jgi:hypothetical protein